jgi:hypothetical protein
LCIRRKSLGLEHTIQFSWSLHGVEEVMLGQSWGIVGIVEILAEIGPTLQHRLVVCEKVVLDADVV